MTRTFAIAAVFVALFSVVSITPGGAQTADPHTDQFSTSGHQRCGTLLLNDGGERAALARTAANHPDVYRRMLERSKRPSAPRILAYGSDVLDTFDMRNNLTGEFEEVVAKRMFVGRRARIWVDVRDTVRVRANTLLTLRRGLDSTTSAASRNPALGIIENDEAVFGQPPANRYDPADPTIEDFLLTDIPDVFPGESILGFFSPWDQTDNPGSNKMNILYIDSKEGLGTQSASALLGVLSTVAHEYQHLIHYNVNPESELFFNEGCSELASTLNGYFDRSNTAFLSNTNVEFFRWSSQDPNEIDADYQRALTFHRYLYEQYGEQLITHLVVTRSEGMQRLADALTAVGRAPDWKGTMKGFWTACYVLRNYPDPRFVFKKALSNSVAKITNTWANTVPASGEDLVEQYGAVYSLFSFSTPAGLKIRFQAGQPYAVMAVMLRNSSIVEVRELVNGVDNDMGVEVGYNKIVLIAINLGLTVQSIRWNATQLVSGVESPVTGDAAALAIDAVAPSPMQGPAAIDFSTPAGGLVTLGVYDMCGRLVRSLVDGERLEAGHHTATFDPNGLPNGSYVVRLVDGARAAARIVSVVR